MENLRKSLQIFFSWSTIQEHPNFSNKNSIRITDTDSEKVFVITNIIQHKILLKKHKFCAAQMYYNTTRKSCVIKIKKSKKQIKNFTKLQPKVLLDK